MSGSPPKPVKPPTFGFRSRVGQKAPESLVAAPPKEDEIKPAAVVRSMFGAVPAAAGAKPKAGPAAGAAAAAKKPAAVGLQTAAKKPAAPAAAAAAAVAKPAKPAAAAAAAAAAAEEEPPALAALLEAQEAPAVLGGLDGDLKEMAGLILNEQRKDLYNTPVPEAYVPQTRRGFADFIKTQYAPFELPAGTIQIPEGEKYYPYQKFVRDYMRQESPYRGVLVYHGLGSGKTCTSIATAEALFASAKKRIVVMTPASLRKNFLREVSFCGFRHYQLKNYWVELDPAEPTTTLFANQVLGLSGAHIAASRAIWVPDFRKTPAESNYESLTPPQRQEIRKQILRMVEYNAATNPTGRIHFINYNGITNKQLLNLACAPGAKGPFDDCVVVIDEIHNLTRLMQGNIEPYLQDLAELPAKGGKKRVIPVEPVKPGRYQPTLCPKPGDEGATKLYKRGYLFFRLLASARNCKIVGLSGTPLINFPEELGILANLLHGYTTLIKGVVPQVGDAAKQRIEEIALANPFTDFVKAKTSEKGGGIEVTMSLLPEGIRKISNDTGVERIPAEEPIPSVEEAVASIRADFTKGGVSMQGEPVVKSQELLPMFGETFKKYFLEKEDSLKNEGMLVTRLTGLVSYYKGSSLELMPRVKSDEIVRVPFSLYAQKGYSARRTQEIDSEKSKKAGKQDMDEVWKKIYGLGDSAAANNYKMGSRQACNFIFPPEVVRPRPATKKEQNEEAKEGVADAELITLGLEDGGAPGGEDAAVQEDFPELEEGEEDAAGAVRAAAAEDAAVRTGLEEDEGEEEMGGGGWQKGGEGTPEAAGDAAAAEAAAPPPAAAEPAAAASAPRKKTLAELREEKRIAAAVAAAAAAPGPNPEDCVGGRKPGEKYQVAMERARNCLKTTAKRRMDLSDPAEGLANYSGKFAAMLERINAAPGPSLVYSQFLSMEGIGLFCTAMDVNGYKPLRIVGKGMGAGRGVMLTFDDETIASLMEGPGKPRYLLFTGGEDENIRRVSLDLFNGRMSELPTSVTRLLQQYGFTTNLHGELCRVFCITSAGAEGLSLRNVRAVHIMEPYWNEVRLRQVKGRAIRIGSHLDLPEAERDVSIYTYLSVFPDQAQGAKAGDYRIDEDILVSDSVDRKKAEEIGLPLKPGQMVYTLTTDEMIYAILERKRKVIEKLETVLKMAAVDCQISYKQNKDGTFRCLPLKGKIGDFVYHPELEEDQKEATKFTMPAAPAVAAAAPAVVAAAPAAAAAMAALGQGVGLPANLPPAAAEPPPAVPGEIFKKFGKKALIYRMVPIPGPDGGAPTGFEMYDLKSKALVGTAGYKGGNPAPPVKAIGGWEF